MDNTVIEKMSHTEKRQIMEKLWISLCQDAESLDTPDWHKRVLSERREVLESGEAEYITIEELKNSID
jgi:hypothetical protein